RRTLVGTPIAGALRLDARLGGAITAPSVDATVGAPALAIGGLSGASLVATPIAGALRLAARLGGAITAPSVDATVGAPALAIGGLSGVSLDANAQYPPTAVTLRQLDVAWQNARL